MDDPLGRLINPLIVVTLIAAGLAYARLLWALNLRPAVTLVVVGIVPGSVYLLTIWAIRAVQGTPSLVYIGLLLDWLLFAGVAVTAVLVARGRR